MAAASTPAIAPFDAHPAKVTVDADGNLHDPLSSDRRRFHSFRNLLLLTQRMVMNCLIKGLSESDDTTQFIDLLRLEDLVHLQKGDMVVKRKGGSAKQSSIGGHFMQMICDGLFTFSEKISLYIHIASWHCKAKAHEKYTKFFYAVANQMIAIGRERYDELNRAIVCGTGSTTNEDEQQEKQNEYLLKFLYALYVSDAGTQHLNLFVGQILRELENLSLATAEEKYIHSIENDDIRHTVFLCTQAGITQVIMDINAVDSSLRISDVLDQLDDTDEGSLNAFVRGITSSSLLNAPFVLAPLFDYLEDSFEFCDEETANVQNRMPVMICGYPSDTDDESKPPEHIPAMRQFANPLQQAQAETEHYKNLYNDTLMKLEELNMEVRWMRAQRECVTPTMEESDAPNL